MPPNCTQSRDLKSCVKNSSSRLNAVKTKNVRTLPIRISCQSPHPAAIPNPAHTHNALAEVNPFTSILFASSRVFSKISPAPRKPMPVAIPWITRLNASGSAVWHPTWRGIITNTAEPTATKICVRKPAGFPFISRFQPMTPPATRAINNRNIIARQSSGQNQISPGKIVSFKTGQLYVAAIASSC